MTSDFSRAASFRAKHRAAVALLPKASAALVHVDDERAVVAAWARDLTRAVTLWQSPAHRRSSLAVPIGAVSFFLAGNEVPPFVVTAAMANGYESWRDDDGGVRLVKPLWDSVGGFDLTLVTGALADAADLDDDLADFAALKECARLKICELAILGIERAAPAFEALPRNRPLTFFCAAHDEDKELLCAL